MIKKYIAILMTITLVCLCSACGQEELTEAYTHLEKLVEVTQELATTYNKVAEDAINNGWEYDDETVEKMDSIATVIESINAGVVAPETFQDGEIEDYIKQVKELVKELDTLAETVAEEYEIEGMTSTQNGN